VTVVLWLCNGGDEDMTGTEERRKKGGERRRYEKIVNETI